MNQLATIFLASVVGALVALGASWMLTGGGDAPVAQPTASETFNAGSIVLAKSVDGCPSGWANGGMTMLLVPPDYALADGQISSELLMMTSETAGWSNVNFVICVKG